MDIHFPSSSGGHNRPDSHRAFSRDALDSAQLASAFDSSPVLSHSDWRALKRLIPGIKGAKFERRVKWVKFSNALPPQLFRECPLQNGRFNLSYFGLQTNSQGVCQQFFDVRDRSRLLKLSLLLHDRCHSPISLPQRNWADR